MNYIFDTNFYRTIATENNLKDAIIIINDLKKRKDETVLFSNIVAIELICHLLDNNNSQEICFNALKLLYIHSLKLEDGIQKQRVAPTFHNLLSIYFFKNTAKPCLLDNNVFLIATEIAKCENLEHLNTLFKKEIELIIEYKKEYLKSIINNLTNYIEGFSPEQDWYVFQNNSELNSEFKFLYKNGDFAKLIGLSFLYSSMKTNKTIITPISHIEFENKFLKEFSVSIKFFLDNIFSKLITIQNLEYFFKPETDPKKRWNSFYDMQLIMAIEYELSFGRKTVFITHEKKILECFNTNGRNQNCMNAVNYMNLE